VIRQKTQEKFRKIIMRKKIREKSNSKKKISTKQNKYHNITRRNKTEK
jgi:hypothetical protein